MALDLHNLLAFVWTARSPSMSSNRNLANLLVLANPANAPSLHLRKTPLSSPCDCWASSAMQ